MDELAPTVPSSSSSSSGAIGSSTALLPLTAERRLLHSRLTAPQYFRMHLLGALFPLTAGVMLYGWRALLTLLLVCGASGVALLIWRTIGSRGRDLEPAHALWMSVLLGMMLPAHLATTSDADFGHALWPIPVAGGALVVMLLWLLGGLGVGRLHPVIVTYLVLVSLFPQELIPHRVLQRDRLVAGDLMNAPDLPEATGLAGSPAWLHRPIAAGHDALRLEPASQSLILYTTGLFRASRGRMPLYALLRDQMPPLEDLIVGGEPRAIGLGSAVAVIMGGLFLLYRGLIDFRIPLLTPLAAFAVMLVLPAPTVITQRGAQWSWLIMRQPDIHWSTAVTFVDYQLMASPLLFVSFFLATAGALRPMGRLARAVYALALGAACAASQLYLSVSFGPYIALLAVGLAAPALDRWFRPRQPV